MSVKRVALALIALSLAAAPARAQDLKDRFNIRISLSGMYLRESQAEDDPVKKIAGPLSIGYGDLRTVLDLRRLPGNFELHLDGVIVSGRADVIPLEVPRARVSSARNGGSSVHANGIHGNGHGVPGG